MIETVIKRDGRQEEANLEKIMGWAKWCERDLGKRNKWWPVMVEVVGKLPSVVHTKEITRAMINGFLSENTWVGQRMAGRLQAIEYYYDTFGSKYLPTVKDVHTKNIELGLQRKLDYSDDDYAVIETIINHKRDLELPYSALTYTRSKYALKNKLTKEVFETQQFIYMRMAMVVAEKANKDVRLDILREVYDSFSLCDSTSPTPNFNSFGTWRPASVSCTLYIGDDSADGISAANHIAENVVTAGAGIGSYMNLRSAGDPIRNGEIVHEGKYKYLRSQGALVTQNMQGSRGGAATSSFQIYDPERELLINLRNPRTPEARRNRLMHFSGIVHPSFMRKALLNQKAFGFNVFTAPDLWEAMFDKTEDRFNELYAKYEADPLFPKEYFSARDTLHMFYGEIWATGTLYEQNPYATNVHTPFKEPIYQSNLCVAGYTNLRIRPSGSKVGVDRLISTLVGQTVDVWNGEEWSSVLVVQTGVNQKLDRVTLRNDYTKDTVDIDATSYHKWYVKGEDGLEREVRTFELVSGMTVSPFECDSELLHQFTVVTVERLEGEFDTFCVNEPKRHRVLFNGVLTGQCMEIVQPTIPYKHTKYLYSTEDHGQGEVSTCNLGAINVAYMDITEENEERYAKAVRTVLRMVYSSIYGSTYPFPHMDLTARSRRNAGVGIHGLATLYARNNIDPFTKEGFEFAHQVAERHMYHLITQAIALTEEMGLAPWMHKTLWPEGWTPKDTYFKAVDEIADFKDRYDWVQVKEDLIRNGGIPFSCLFALMPGESSSKPVAVPNSIWQLRDLAIKKTDGQNSIDFVAPEAEDLDYSIAWDASLDDQIRLVAVFQKWADQAISFEQFRKIGKADKIPFTELLTSGQLRARYGIKTTYYANSNTHTDNRATAYLTAFNRPYFDTETMERLLGAEAYVEMREICEACDA